MDEPAPSSETPPNELSSVEPAPPPEEPTLLAEVETPSSDAQAAITRPLPENESSWHTHLSRRQVLAGIGIATGVVGLGLGLTALLHSAPSLPAPGAPDAQGTAQNPRPTPQTTASPASLAQTLEDWRTKRLTIQPTQRFQSQSGKEVVPLGVVEPVYPNPYNPYMVHLHAYLLGGEVIENTQLFWYLGVESRDGTQFVAKVRVGPLDKTADQFSLLVTQQQQDTIVGGGAPDYPPAQLTPKALSQALPGLAGHCLVLILIRQTLPPEAQGEGVPPALFTEINQQVDIADHFLSIDFAVVHTTPLAQVPQSDMATIRDVIDDLPITYRTPTDGDKYPLMTQVVLRHSDQLFPKLGK